MLPPKHMSGKCITLLNQHSSLNVSVPLVLNPRFGVADDSDMAEQFESLVHVLLVKCDKGLDDVSLSEMRVFLGVVGETRLELGYLQMLPF